MLIIDAHILLSVGDAWKHAKYPCDIIPLPVFDILTMNVHVTALESAPAYYSVSHIYTKDTQ